MTSPERRVPNDPLNFIRECVWNRRVLWTYHVNMRLEKRFISRESIPRGIESYEIIEEYPNDKYLPSYLVLAHNSEGVFHVLFAVDVEGVNVRIVTAYRPKLDEWEEGFKTRRKRQ